MMTKMKPNDPVYWMLHDGIESTPTTYNKTCYICNDSEYAQMGLPLCYECLICKAHVPADDHICDNGHIQPTDPVEEIHIRKNHGLEISFELAQQAKDVVENMYNESMENLFKNWGVIEEDKE